MAVKLGEMLIKAGLLTPQKLEDALEYQKTHGGKLGLNLINLGIVKETEITRVLSQQYGVPSISSASWPRMSIASFPRSRCQFDQ